MKLISCGSIHSYSWMVQDIPGHPRLKILLEVWLTGAIVRRDGGQRNVNLPVSHVATSAMSKDS